MYFMVISCDRGGGGRGGEQQRVSSLEMEEVMVLSLLCLLPQKEATSNGSEGRPEVAEEA